MLDQILIALLTRNISQEKESDTFAVPLLQVYIYLRMKLITVILQKNTFFSANQVTQLFINSRAHLWDNFILNIRNAIKVGHIKNMIQRRLGCH